MISHGLIETCPKAVNQSHVDYHKFAVKISLITQSGNCVGFSCDKKINILSH